MQGTGHNAVPMGPLDDTMLVKTCGMRGVEIDADHRVARVEAGALWIDVTAPASEAGLAPHASGGQYLNFAERPTDPAAYYGEETYARLCRVKARVDPLERFRGNQEIPAA